MKIGSQKLHQQHKNFWLSVFDGGRHKEDRDV